MCLPQTVLLKVFALLGSCPDPHPHLWLKYPAHSIEPHDDITASATQIHSGILDSYKTTVLDQIAT